MEPTDSPIVRLRTLHEQDCNCMCTCVECNSAETPCDSITALDALEADISAMADGPSVDWWQHTVNELQARLDAVTVLIATSIDTCPNCAPYRAWLAGLGSGVQQRA